jgi:chromatin modification-related protein EAF6
MSSTTSSKTIKEVTSEITALEERRDTIEKSLAQLERQIVALETSYLEDTNHTGNLLRGWEGYLSSRYQLHQSTSSMRLLMA